jgi:WD40 repeat protein
MIDGKPHALAGCGDECLLLYNLVTGHVLVPVLRGHTGKVRAVVLSPDGRRALSGSYDGTLRWWALKAGSCVNTLEGHTGEVYAVALSGDGRRTLSGPADGRLRWWDLEAGRLRAYGFGTARTPFRDDCRATLARSRG